MVHKKVNYVLVLFCLSIFSLSSCTKISKQDTTIEFVVRNPANGEPFVGVPVKIVEETAPHKLYQGGTFFEGVTDENGRVSHTFKARKGSGVWYYPYIDESYFEGEYWYNWTYCARPEVSSYAMKKDEYNEALFEVTYYAYLKSIVKNINCMDDTDTLLLRQFNKDFILPINRGGYDYSYTFTGCYDHETNGGVDGSPEGYFRTYMGWHNAEWTAIKEGVVTHGKDSVFLEAGSLGTLPVYY